MHFEISKSLLENYINKINPFLEKEINEIYSHIHISTENNTLTLKGSDFEIGLKINSKEVKIIQEGAITCNGKLFGDIVHILNNNENIKIQGQDNNLVHITQSNSEYKLQSFDPSTYRVDLFSNLDDQNFTNIDIDFFKLCSIFKQVLPAISNDPVKNSLGGILLDFSQDKLTLVSTDTRRLAYVHFDHKVQDNFQIIVPKKAIIEIIKLCSEDAKLKYNENYIVLEMDNNNIFFFSSLILDKFPQYENIIPKNFSHNIKLNRNQVLNGIRQIKVISENIKMIISQEYIILESMSKNNTEAKTKININNNNQETCEIAFNSIYFTDFLSASNQDEFIFKYNDQNTPFELESGNLKTLIMPISL